MINAIYTKKVIFYKQILDVTKNHFKIISFISFKTLFRKENTISDSENNFSEKKQIIRLTNNSKYCLIRIMPQASIKI